MAFPYWSAYDEGTRGNAAVRTRVLVHADGDADQEFGVCSQTCILGVCTDVLLCFAALLCRGEVRHGCGRCSVKWLAQLSDQHWRHFGRAARDCQSVPDRGGVISSQVYAWFLRLSGVPLAMPAECRPQDAGQLGVNPLSSQQY